MVESPIFDQLVAEHAEPQPDVHWLVAVCYHAPDEACSQCAGDDEILAALGLGVLVGCGGDD